MKSIKEKAKTYDGNYKTYTELINRLEDVKNAIKKQNYGIAMDILCKPYPEYQITASPELKESEDERIRKAIYNCVKWFGFDSCFFKDVSQEECLAWIEKQGEQKPADTEKGTNGNERKTSIPEPPLTIKHAKEVMGIKQNDAWAEEDEKMYTATIFALAGFMGNKDKLDWLKSLKERVQPLPKQEWNEEDEQTFIKSVEALEDSYNFMFADWLKEHKNQLLRPQSTWKPSDEQIEMLENVRKILHTNDIYSKANHLMYNFEELIRTLKKLREGQL